MIRARVLSWSKCYVQSHLYEEINLSDQGRQYAMGLSQAVAKKMGSRYVRALTPPSSRSWFSSTGGVFPLLEACYDRSAEHISVDPFLTGGAI